MLLHLLGLRRPASEERLPCVGRPEIKTNQISPPDLGSRTPLVTCRGDTVCDSTLPQYLVSSSTPLATASTEFREGRPVASGEGRCTPVNTKEDALVDKGKAKLLLPRNSLSQGEEVGVIKGNANESQALLQLSRVVEDLYPVGVDESERYTRNITV